MLLKKNVNRVRTTPVIVGKIGETAGSLLAITNPDIRPSSRYKSGALSGISLSLFIG